MKLKRISRLLFGLVSGVLLLNLGLLLAIRTAQDHIERAAQRAETAHAEVDELVQGTELLASLVQGYATTARTRYLDLYCEILGVWQGERPAPVASAEVACWRQRIGDAGALPALPLAGTSRSMIERLRALDFTAQELQAAQAVLDGTATLQVEEKIAFAATCDIPVLFLTALSQPEDESRGFESGGADFIHKPFNLETAVDRFPPLATLHEH